MLSLGAYSSKKGRARRVHAWSKVEAKYPGWRLRIAGTELAICRISELYGLTALAAHRRDRLPPFRGLGRAPAR